MEIILNKRQLDILKQLENSKQYISASALANSYDVSIRTIRSDIKELTYFLEDYDCVFEKIPHVGMRLITRQPIADQLSSCFDLSNFVIFEREIRTTLLILTILAHDREFITLGYLSELFLISKNTTVRELEEADSCLKDYNLKLRGIKSKGYRITGKPSAKEELLVSLLDNRNYLQYLDVLMLQEKNLIIARTVVKKVREFLQNETDIHVTELKEFIQKMSFYLLMEHQDEDKTPDDETVRKILEIASDQMGYQIPATPAFYQLMYKTTSFHQPSSMTLAENERFIRGMDALMDKLIELSPDLLYDRQLLRNDLESHFQITYDRMSQRYSLENPLLDSIKLNDIEIFNLALTVAKEFNVHFPEIKITEDEAGYIALYISLYKEKSRSINEASVMVVCNSGVGAARLLSNRIMNAFPEIHIKMIKSYIDLQHDVDFLDNIDLIISTVRIPDTVSKPFVVVSPFLSIEELIKVREAIWIVNRNRKHILSEVDETGELNLQEISIETGNPVINNGITFYKLAEISMETFHLVGQIYPRRIENDKYMMIEGVLAHVVMSVERWVNHEFLNTYDFDDLKIMYREKYDLINAYLKRVSEILNIFIDPIEAAAILRYFILEEN